MNQDVVTTAKVNFYIGGNIFRNLQVIVTKTHVSDHDLVDTARSKGLLKAKHGDVDQTAPLVDEHNLFLILA